MIKQCTQAEREYTDDQTVHTLSSIHERRLHCSGNEPEVDSLEGKPEAPASKQRSAIGFLSGLDAITEGEPCH